MKPLAPFLEGIRDLASLVAELAFPLFGIKHPALRHLQIPKPYIAALQRQGQTLFGEPQPGRLFLHDGTLAPTLQNGTNLFDIHIERSHRRRPHRLVKTFVPEAVGRNQHADGLPLVSGHNPGEEITNAKTLGKVRPRRRGGGQGAGGTRRTAHLSHPARKAISENRPSPRTKPQIPGLIQTVAVLSRPQTPEQTVLTFENIHHGLAGQNREILVGAGSHASPDKRPHPLETGGLKLDHVFRLEQMLLEQMEIGDPRLQHQILAGQALDLGVRIPRPGAWHPLIPTHRPPSLRVTGFLKTA